MPKTLMPNETIAILGAGSWGTVLGDHLARLGHTVRIWGRDAAVLEEISQSQTNAKFLPGIPLTKELAAEESLGAALSGASVCVFGVPSSAVRETAKAVAKTLSSTACVVSTAKGLEEDTLLRPSEVLAEELGGRRKIAVLSGPSFAVEVAKGVPTAITVAASNSEVATQAAALFHGRNVRIYTSTDVCGVELGGALKNVIALAIGLVDGLSFGANARAALFTRGMAEMARLIVALGGEEKTLYGLSGLGDLFLTATGDLSRNRRVGMRLAKGENIEAILSDIGQVAEGA